MNLVLAIVLRWTLQRILDLVAFCLLLEGGAA